MELLNHIALIRWFRSQSLPKAANKQSYQQPQRSVLKTEVLNGISVQVYLVGLHSSARLSDDIKEHTKQLSMQSARGNDSRANQ